MVDDVYVVVTCFWRNTPLFALTGIHVRQYYLRSHVSGETQRLGLWVEHGVDKDILRTMHERVVCVYTKQGLEWCTVLSVRSKQTH